MSDKKIELIKCGFRACGAYAVLSFLWLAFVALGTSAVSSGGVISDNSAFAARLLGNNFAIALYSAVYGFSFLVLKVKNISSAATRSLHILMNYVAAMVCVYFLHTGAEAKASAWIILLFFATIIFFVIYGVAFFISYLIKKNK